MRIDFDLTALFLNNLRFCHRVDLNFFTSVLMGLIGLCSALDCLLLLTNINTDLHLEYFLILLLCGGLRSRVLDDFLGYSFNFEV